VHYKTLRASLVNFASGHYLLMLRRARAQEPERQKQAGAGLYQSYRQPARVVADIALEPIKPTMVPLSALPVMTIDAPETNSAISVNGTV
jgi:hypothetical protein